MTDYLLFGACWLLLPLPLTVLIGKCISVGLAGADAQHPADGAVRDRAEASQPPVQASSGTALAAVPAQRRPAARTEVVS